MSAFDPKRTLVESPTAGRATCRISENVMANWNVYYRDRDRTAREMTPSRRGLAAASGGRAAVDTSLRRPLGVLRQVVVDAHPGRLGGDEEVALRRQAAGIVE